MPDYPNIAKACLLIALDNGGINIRRSEATQRREYEQFIARQAAPLDEIDAWLGTLTKHQLDTLCNGEAHAIDQLLRSAPAFTDDLLNAYFNEVC